jgi:hypothetical protein
LEDSKLLPLMREMEKTRSDWHGKFELTGVFDTAAANKMIDLRQQLVWSHGTSTVDLLIQCATLQSVSLFVFELLGRMSDQAEQTENQMSIARESIAELSVGLLAIQASLENAAGVTANDLGLFIDTGKLN